jgi:hypothetical protein
MQISFIMPLLSQSLAESIQFIILSNRSTSGTSVFSQVSAGGQGCINSGQSSGGKSEH